MVEFKQVLLDTIKEIEQDGTENKPISFKWTYLEAPNWEIVMNFRKVKNGTST